ncbi:hypothetical protein CC78DRAFT_576163 [Lojkania enalia]|uniref:Uncharacterized protein n=1 Tax=Lojkania enalia TaxID=147567 RepID=A0A9P4KGI6_9PLEO|nr:hypothetical protein CC78DRAFT_576163 [Didymosphaeria enalia]
MQRKLYLDKIEVIHYSLILWVLCDLMLRELQLSCARETITTSNERDDIGLEERSGKTEKRVRSSSPTFREHAGVGAGVFLMFPVEVEKGHKQGPGRSVSCSQRQVAINRSGRTPTQTIGPRCDGMPAATRGRGPALGLDEKGLFYRNPCRLTGEVICKRPQAISAYADLDLESRRVNGEPGLGQWD